MRETSTLQRLKHERALWRYVTALEEGDLDTLALIMQQAEHDETLERLILEMHETFQTDEEFQALLQEEKTMEIEEGVHKSGMLGRLLAPTRDGSPRLGKRRSFWLQALVATLLVVLLGGTLLFYSNLLGHHTAQTASRPVVYSWCVTSGAQIDAQDELFTLNNAVALSASNIWAVGDARVVAAGVEQFQLRIEHWDGAHWLSVASPNTSASLTMLQRQVDASSSLSTLVSLYDLSALSARNIWAVGTILASPGSTQATQQQVGQTLIEHWDGVSWQVVASPNAVASSQNVLNSVDAIAPDDVWAAGFFTSSTQSASDTHTLLEHWDGQQWSLVTLPASLVYGSFNSIRAVSASDIWAVGTDQRGGDGLSLAAHWNGHTWSRSALPASLQSGSFSDVATIATNDAWAVGNFSSTGTGSSTRSVLAHWDGSRWTPVLGVQVGRVTNGLFGVAAGGPNDVWAVGNMQTVDGEQTLIEHWDGTTWKIVSSHASPPGSLSHVMVVGKQVWALGTASSRIDSSFSVAAGSLFETNC
jgi:hypothetical protein